MPSNIVKPGEEGMWKRAKKEARKSYPDMSDDDDSFWAIVTKIFKNIRDSKKNESIDRLRVLSGLEPLYERASEYEKLKKNKKPLTDDERKECFKADAVWHYASSINPLTGKKERKVAAVWKSVDKDGKETFVTNTHRAYNTAPTLKGAIRRFHDFIKGTA